MSLLRSATINQGCHIGLQQLEAMAAATHTFLGPSKCYKMIQDEASGEGVLVCSCYRLLEQLELNSSVAQLLRETTRAHWGTFCSGTATLFFLAGVWSRVALECLHQGISIQHIMTSMSKGLEMCLEACKLSAVNVESVCKDDRQNQQLRPKSQSGRDCLNTEDSLHSELSVCNTVRKLAQSSAKTVNSVSTLCPSKDQRLLKHKSKLKHSRHFNSNHVAENRSMHTRFDIACLAEAVSHGCEMTMRLVIEASKIQCQYSRDSQCHKALEVDKLVTCLLPGLTEEHMRAVHGYVVLLSAEQASLMKHLDGRTLKITLVHGDLSETHRHLGFNRPKNVTYICGSSDLKGISREEEWMNEALRILLNLKVDIILVSGCVTEQLKDHCLHHHILIIEHVRVSILDDFSTATGALPVSYITQLSEHCIGSGVCVNTLREYRTEGTECTVVRVVTESTTLVTVLIASSVHAKLQSMEDQFWSCAYRVHHALKDGKLLPGAGTVELLCIHQLQNQRNVSRTEERGDDERGAARGASPYEQVVLQLMAEGWMNYVATLMVNAGHVKSKTQAWTCIAQHIKQWGNKVPQNNEIPEALLKLKIMQNGEESEEDEKEEERMVKRERIKLGVYDNMIMKFEVWRRALDLVFLILQTDTEIITGINNQEEQYKDSVIL